MAEAAGASYGTATSSGQVPLSHRQILIVFGTLMVGMLLAALDQMIVSTALPTIVGDLGGLEHLSWVITAYLLTSTASMPLYGKLSDFYGRKILFQFAIVVFLAGSLVAGASQSMLQLIASRGLQGLGAGGIMAMAQAIIGDIISPRERGRYQGYMGSVFALASIAGPLLGGLFVDHLTWRWVFYVNLPVGALALVTTTFVLRLPHRRVEHQIDYLGAALMVSGVSCLLLMTSWGGSQYAWGSPMIISLAVAGVILTGLFIVQEGRAPEPVLPLRLFRERIVTVTSGVGFVIGLAMFGSVAFMPLYFQVVKGASAAESGLRMTPMMLGVVGASIISGRLISETGRYRIFPITGTAMMAAGMYLLSRLGTGTGLLEVSAYMLVTGIGIGLVMQVMVLAVQNAVAFSDLGVATASANFFRSMGGAFGVAVFGSILNNRLDYYFPRLVPSDAITSFGSRALTASPAQIRTLPAPVLAGVLEAFARSLHAVFLVAVPIAVVAFILTLFLREIPLREYAHVGTGESQAPAPAAAPGPAGRAAPTVPMPAAGSARSVADETKVDRRPLPAAPRSPPAVTGGSVEEDP